MKKNLFSIFAVALIFTSFSVFAVEDEGAKPVEAKDKPEDVNSQAYKDQVKKQVEEYNNYKSNIAKFENSEKFKKEILTDKKEFEVTIGKPEAPIQIVEYLSLTCVHCRDFHETVFYDLKKEYIDEGKVYMKIRHFPLNGSAVKAVMLLDCVEPMNRLAFISALFKSQPQWAFVQNEAQLIERMKVVTKIAGISDEQFDKCYADSAKQDKILNQMKEAAEGLLIDSTPALFVDNSRYLGGRDYKTFKKMLDEKLADVKPAEQAVDVKQPAEEASKKETNKKKKKKKQPVE